MFPPSGRFEILKTIRDKLLEILNARDRVIGTTLPSETSGVEAFDRMMMRARRIDQFNDMISTDTIDYFQLSFGQWMRITRIDQLAPTNYLAYYSFLQHLACMAADSFGYGDMEEYVRDHHLIAERDRIQSALQHDIIDRLGKILLGDRNGVLNPKSDKEPNAEATKAANEADQEDDDDEEEEE